MIEMKSRLGLMTGVMVVACRCRHAPQPRPVTRTVSTEQVTTTTPPPPPPPITTTTTENVATPDEPGTRMVTSHRRWSRDNGDVDEETTETVVPVVPAPPPNDHPGPRHRSTTRSSFSSGNLSGQGHFSRTQQKPGEARCPH